MQQRNFFMRNGFIGLMAVSSVSTGAYASTLVENGAFSIDTTVSPSSSSDNVSFAQFDSSLGTLTGIDVALTGNANSVVSFLSTDPSNAIGTGSNSTTLQLVSTAGAGLTLTSSTLLASVTNATINGAGSMPYAVTNYAGAASAVNLTGSLDSTSFAAFTGAGTVNALSAVFPSSTPSGSNNVPQPYIGYTGGGGQASGEITVTYDYTPVPLPAAAWLLVSGLGGVGVFARRRKAA